MEDGLVNLIVHKIYSIGWTQSVTKLIDLYHVQPNHPIVEKIELNRSQN